MLFGLSLIWVVRLDQSARDCGGIGGQGPGSVAGGGHRDDGDRFGFKVAVRVPSVGARMRTKALTPSAAFIASGSKVASFIFAKIMMIGFRGREGSGRFEILPEAGRR